MAHCSKCGGNRVKVSATTVRRFFTIRCLRRGCGVTTVRDLSISAALAGVFVRPQRTHGINKNHTELLKLSDRVDY